MKPCSKCGGPKDYRFVRKGKIYFRCHPCMLAATKEWKKENTDGYRNRVSDCQAQKHRIHQAPKPSKTLWMPVWAADLKEPDPHDRENYQAYEARMAIVAAVREARAAQRRLGVGR